MEGCLDLALVVVLRAYTLIRGDANAGEGRKKFSCANDREDDEGQR